MNERGRQWLRLTKEAGIAMKAFANRVKAIEEKLGPEKSKDRNLVFLELYFPGDEVDLNHREAIFARNKYQKDFKGVEFWKKERGGKANNLFYTTETYNKAYKPPTKKELVNIIRYLRSLGDHDAAERVYRTPISWTI